MNLSIVQKNANRVTEVA